MKEKRAGRIIILVTFFTIICISRVIWIFAKNYLDTVNYENRPLTARPALTINNYGTFSSEYTYYFNDNLQFRNYLITLNSWIDYFCFQKSSSNNVIVGDENWLFYSSIEDGDPVSCYQGTNLLTEEELTEIAENCIAQRDFLLAQGKEYVIFLAPNKERIYSEYMPEKYGKPAENYRVLQIYNYLKNNTDIRVVYPYAELMRAKEKTESNIYYKTDTHWNYIGGYIGASALMKELGIDMPALNDNRIAIVAGDHISGDLAGMLGLKKQMEFADKEFSVKGFDLHDSVCTGSDIRGLWAYQTKNADPRCIYVIRDSFSLQMGGYLGSQFSKTYLRHINTYDYNELVSCNPDIVVFELAERYADRLATFSIRKGK